MNKKILTLAVLTLFSLALTTAFLVTYLSNQVSASQTIESPIELEISMRDDNGWAETLPLDNMYTGGRNTVTFYTRETNIAPESVTGDIENIVTCDLGVKCIDFESVVVSTKTGTGNYGDSVNLMTLNEPYGCEQVNSQRIKFNYPNPQTWSANQVDINMITVTFEDVVGEYIFTSRVVPTA
ncbi:hypothetical protein ES703_63017 [subsurface metagenome]